MPGRMNCQAETPAARITASSSRRLSARNAAMEPNSTANGRNSSVSEGVLNSEASTASPAEKVSRSTERRISSIESARKMMALPIRKKPPIHRMKITAR